jgi:hypothetical protein
MSVMRRVASVGVLGLVVSTLAVGAAGAAKVNPKDMVLQPVSLGNGFTHTGTAITSGKGSFSSFGSKRPAAGLEAGYLELYQNKLPTSMSIAQMKHVPIEVLSATLLFRTAKQAVAYVNLPDVCPQGHALARHVPIGTESRLCFYKQRSRTVAGPMTVKGYYLVWIEGPAVGVTLLVAIDAATISATTQLADQQEALMAVALGSDSTSLGTKRPAKKTTNPLAA